METESITGFAALWQQAARIWVSGGWAMYPLAIDAFLMSYFGFHILLRIRAKGYLKVGESKWKKWINHPEKRKGPIGRMLDFVTGARSLEELGTLFEELNQTEIAPFDRDLKVMQSCVSVAPLLGLLGTVTGMLATFSALATGSGGEKTMAMIAGGISEALITTEAGLIIALPGLIFQFKLAREHERYKAFLVHLETICMQKFYKKQRDAAAV